MADIYRRCGCRREDGKNYPLLPDRATDAQKANACPRLLSDPSHGRWGYYLSAGFDPGSGKRVQERKATFATKREAQQERARKVTEYENGTLKPKSKTLLRDYLTEWLQRRKEDGLRPATIEQYGRYIRDDISRKLGAVKLTELTRHQVDEFIRGLRNEGRGAVTIRRIYVTLNTALGDAVRRDLIAVNPAANVSVPSPARKPIAMWEPQEAQQFLDGIASDRLAVLFEFAMYTGMRRGEIAGLRWADVDLVASVATVRQQRVIVGKTITTGPVKTEAGQDRRVHLGANVVGSLIAWQMRQADEAAMLGSTYNPDGYVFTTALGEPLRPDYLTKRFDTLVERSGLPRMRFHGLRHLHASLLLASGVELSVVSKRLGHSTLAVTSDLYGHLLDETNRRAAAAMDALMATTKGGGAQQLHNRRDSDDHA